MPAMLSRALIPSVLVIFAAGDAECKAKTDVDEVAMLQARISNHRASSDVPPHPYPLSGVMAREWKQFQAVKDLRKKGHTCPSGTYFAADPNTESDFLFDCRLWMAAGDWSEYMGKQNIFKHTSGPPQNSTPCTRTADWGLEACTEIIAAQYPYPLATLQNMLRNDVSCKEIMDPQVNRFGVGFAEVPGSTYMYYWTQSLGTSDVGADQRCLGIEPSPTPTPSPTPS